MTGFEVVGLALAIFPLVIEGLKFYAEEKGLVKDFLRYRHVLKRLIQDLSREQTSFHNSCQRFMEDIAVQCGLGEDEIAMMMHNPQDPRWSEADMLATIASDSLKQRSVEAYLDAVNVMNEELAKIQELAGLSEDAQVRSVPDDIENPRKQTVIRFSARNLQLHFILNSPTFSTNTPAVDSGAKLSLCSRRTTSPRTSTELVDSTCSSPSSHNRIKQA